MAGLGGEDAAGRGEVVGRGDVGRGAEVGGHADAFENGREGYEGFRVGVGEAVRAFRGWRLLRCQQSEVNEEGMVMYIKSKTYLTEAGEDG